MSCLATADHLSCTACPLSEYRTQVVPGHGNPNASIMLIAEAPGKVEDETGAPLVGPAGRRLDSILERSGLKRTRAAHLACEVYVSNLVHCRPPDNDLSPYPDSLITCPDLWLDKEIERVDPKVLVVMGGTAGARWFPGYRAGEIAGLQRMVEVGITRRAVVGSLHPSAALYRQGSWNSVDESIKQSLERAKELCEVRAVTRR